METITLKDFSDSGRLLSTRHVALGIRDQIEHVLDAHADVELDFGGTNPTQSFVDELVGSLVTDRGASVLEHLVMKNCSHEVQSILHFVVSDRLDQLSSRTVAEFAD